MIFNASQLYRESLKAQGHDEEPVLTPHGIAILATIDAMYLLLSKQIHALKTEGQDE